MLLSSNTPPARSQFWDVVRGIGILSIVMGHCFSHSVIYVYTYHLAIFFFVSGFLYNEKKYGRDPFAHIGAKLKSSWPKYMLYMSIFVLLHNPFQTIGINIPGDYYTPSQTLAQLGNAFVFYSTESMDGAMWFVPTWIFACGLFGGIVYFAQRLFPDISPFPDRAANSIPDSRSLFAFRRQLFILCISLLFGTAGAFLILRNYVLFYRMHLVFLVQPFFAAGWLLKIRFPQYKTWLKWYAAIPCALLLSILVNIWQLNINIAVGRIGNGWQFFFFAFLGIYCSMTLAVLLEKVNILCRLFSLWGRYSFDIMALHFFFFKLIDVICGNLLHHPLEFYSAFPHAYGSFLWPLYIITGTTIPALIGKAIDHLKL